MFMRFSERLEDLDAATLGESGFLVSDSLFPVRGILWGWARLVGGDIRGRAAVFPPGSRRSDAERIQFSAIPEPFERGIVLDHAEHFFFVRAWFRAVLGARRIPRALQLVLHKLANGVMNRNRSDRFALLLQAERVEEFRTSPHLSRHEERANSAVRLVRIAQTRHEARRQAGLLPANQQTPQQVAFTRDQRRGHCVQPPNSCTISIAHGCSSAPGSRPGLHFFAIRILPLFSPLFPRLCPEAAKNSETQLHGTARNLAGKLLRGNGVALFRAG